MNRRKFNKHKVIRTTLFILIAIGLLSQFSRNPSGMLIPILVFGVVYYLYKFPPNRSRRDHVGRSPFHTFRSMFTQSNSQQHAKRKPPAFRVIPGNKKDEEEDPPRYH